MTILKDKRADQLKSAKARKPHWCRTWQPKWKNCWTKWKIAGPPMEVFAPTQTRYTRKKNCPGMGNGRIAFVWLWTLACLWGKPQERAHVVLRGRRGTLWHSMCFRRNIYCNRRETEVGVSMWEATQTCLSRRVRRCAHVVLRGRRNTHPTFYTPHSTLHSLHSTLHTLRSTLHTPHFTLHTLHSTLYGNDIWHICICLPLLFVKYQCFY